MSRWFRYYDEALDDPKVQRLSGDLFKVWVNLLSLASKNDGKLPSADDISFRLRISVQDAQQRVEDLIIAGLIDILPDKTLVPHNWSERQFASDSSALRMQKLRKKKQSKNRCDVTGDGTVTPQIISYSDTDTEPNGLPSFLPPARSREVEDPKGLNKFFEMKDDGKKERLHRRAEGLGLDVAELIDACNVHKAKNKPAYFTSLCVQKLQTKVKGLSEEVIRSALWDKGDEAYARLINVLLVAP